MDHDAINHRGVGRDFRATLGLTPTAYAAAFDWEHEGSGAVPRGI